MRFLISYRYKDNNDSLQFESKVLESRSNDVYVGQLQIIKKVSEQFGLEPYIIDRDYSNEKQLGIMYCNPKSDNRPTELRDPVVDDEILRYERDINNKEISYT